MTTKTCSSCQQALPATQFAWKNKKKGKRHSKCRTCTNRYNQQRYAADPEPRRQQIRQRRDTNKQTLRQLRDQWLADKTCSSCSTSTDLFAVAHHNSQPLHDMVRNGVSKQTYTEALQQATALCASCNGVVHNTDTPATAAV